MAEIFQSNFVFGLQGNLYQDFCDNIAHPIIQNIIGSNDYEIIAFEKHLSLLDFDTSKRKESIFPEFYLNFLGDIIKESDSVSFKKKVCITLDETLCTDTCQKTGRKITAIKLAGIELAYFIYFDIKDFFKFVYEFNHNELNKQNIKDGQNSHKEIQVNKQEVQDKSLVDNNQDTTILDKVDVSKFFSGKQADAKIKIQREYIERIGYISNINKERGLSFICDSPNNKVSNFPIPHKDFPEIIEYAIGTPIKAFGYFNDNKFYVDDYEIIDIDELPFQLMRLSGTLKYDENSKFAIIRTNVGGVYTSLRLVQEYEPNIVHQVECIAVEAYDYTKQENGWKAIWVG